MKVKFADDLILKGAKDQESLGFTHTFRTKDFKQMLPPNLFSHFIAAIIRLGQSINPRLNSPIYSGLLIAGLAVGLIAVSMYMLIAIKYQWLPAYQSNKAQWIIPLALALIIWLLLMYYVFDIKRAVNSLESKPANVKFRYKVASIAYLSLSFIGFILSAVYYVQIYGK